MFRYLILALAYMTVTHPIYASQTTFEEQHTLIPAPRSMVMVDADATCAQKLAYSCAKVGYCCDYKQPFCSSDGVISDSKTELLLMTGGGGFIGGTLIDAVGIFGQLTIYAKWAGFPVLQWTGVGCCGCGCLLCTASCCLGSRRWNNKEWFDCSSRGECCSSGGECRSTCITKNCCPNYAREYEQYYTKIKQANKPAAITMEG